MRVALDRPSTDLILAGQAPADWSGLPGETQRRVRVVLRGRPRGLWDEMDGYEKFSGYGYEDLAFCIAAENLRQSKQVVRVPAPLYHLHHQPSPESSPRSLLALNRKRFLAYRTLEGRRDALDEFLHLDPHGPDDDPAHLPPHRPVQDRSQRSGRSGDVPTAPRPRRVGVRDMADPLDPAEWPLTAKAWDKCANRRSTPGSSARKPSTSTGGFYIDSDVECLRSWETLRFAPAVAGGRTTP